MTKAGRGIRAAFALFAAGVIVASSAAPATAGPVEGCYDGYWCAYVHRDFGGDQCSWYYSAKSYASWCDNIMSSHVNNGDGVVSFIQWFEHTNYSGWRDTVASVKEYPDGRNPWVGLNNNDKMSSHLWCQCG